MNYCPSYKEVIDKNPHYLPDDWMNRKWNILEQEYGDQEVLAHVKGGNHHYQKVKAILQAELTKKKFAVNDKLRNE